MRDIAAWQGERDIDGRNAAVDAVEREPQAARADIVTHEHLREPLHVAARERDDRVLGEDRLEQITQRMIDRRRYDRPERLLDAAERLVDPLQQLGGKTRRKRRARLVE